jgi:hypothetical protein
MAAHSCVARILAQRRPPAAGPRIHAPTKATPERAAIAPLQISLIMKIHSEEIKQNQDSFLCLFFSCLSVDAR